MKNLAIVAMLSIFLIGIKTTTLSIPLIEAEETIFIRADGSVDPPTASIERNRDTYTFTANISAPIVIQRDSIVVDGNGYALQGSGAGTGFELRDRSSVAIKNLYIKGFIYGILVYHSPNSIITNNIVTDNSWDGIFLTYSDGSIINNNIIANHSKWGLYIGSSIGITLRNNQMIGNTWNFGVSEKFIHDIAASNTVDGKPIYYLVNQQDKQVPANAGYIAVVNSTNISARNLNLTKNGQGVVLVNSKNCLLENSIITKMGYYGIQLIDSCDNTISNNNITDNKPPYFGVGIAVQHSSTGNTIRNNLIKNNEKGILFYESNANAIYHNNFVENIIQASTDRTQNTWDNGYPSGGNYWSSYTGVDEKNDQHQDKPGKDGIGDTPFVIDENNQDNYPFMSLVPQEISYTSIIGDLTLAFIIVATVITVALLTYFLKAGKHVNKKLQTVVDPRGTTFHRVTS